MWGLGSGVSGVRRKTTAGPSTYHPQADRVVVRFEIYKDDRAVGMIDTRMTGLWLVERVIRRAIVFAY